MKIQPPSKKFVKSAGIITICLMVFLGVQIYSKNKKTNPEIKNETVSSLVGKDSNKNGIPDWEERIWGLDPSVTVTNGVSNKEIIEQKKASIGINTNDGSLTETDKVAREIFAVTAALSQNENIDTSAIGEVAQKIGEGSNIEIRDAITVNDIKTIATTQKSLSDYYKKLITTLSKYEKNASESEILVKAIEEEGNVSELSKLGPIAGIYKNLVEDLSKMVVPVGIIREHIGIVNSFNNIQIGLSLIANTEKDAIRGAGGASIYRAGLITLEIYNNSLRDYLTRYSII